MNVLIVDDERPARDRLRQIIESEPGYVVVGEAGNGREAIVACESLQPDVVLLDIRMPGLGGIETAHHLNSLPKTPAVIFTTAYDEHAVEAFEARAVGYVLKPVRRSRLMAAMQQASRLAPKTLWDVAQEARIDRTRNNICANSHGELKLIPVSSIVCFRAEQKYVVVEHDAGEDLIDDSLKGLADEFSAFFVRIHRNTLVAVARVDRIEKGSDGKSRVILRERSPVSDNELIISRRHVAEVRRRLKGI